METLKRVVAGIGQIAWSATACAIFAVVMYAQDGELIVRRGGLPLGQLLILYGVITVASGIVLGLLKPFAKGSTGTALVGILATWPAAISIVVLSREGRIRDLDIVDYAISIGIAVVFGPLIAAYAKLRRQQQKQ